MTALTALAGRRRQGAEIAALRREVAALRRLLDMHISGTLPDDAPPMLPARHMFPEHAPVSLRRHCVG